jgi:hypothetical protein
MWCKCRLYRMTGALHLLGTHTPPPSPPPPTHWQSLEEDLLSQKLGIFDVYSTDEAIGLPQWQRFAKVQRHPFWNSLAVLLPTTPLSLRPGPPPHCKQSHCRAYHPPPSITGCPPRPRRHPRSRPVEGERLTSRVTVLGRQGASRDMSWSWQVIVCGGGEGRGYEFPLRATPRHVDPPFSLSPCVRPTPSCSRTSQANAASG